MCEHPPPRGRRCSDDRGGAALQCPRSRYSNQANVKVRHGLLWCTSGAPFSNSAPLRVRGSPFKGSLCPSRVSRMSVFCGLDTVFRAPLCTPLRRPSGFGIYIYRALPHGVRTAWHCHGTPTRFKASGMQKGVLAGLRRPFRAAIYPKGRPSCGTCGMPLRCALRPAVRVSVVEQGNCSLCEPYL